MKRALSIILLFLFLFGTATAEEEKNVIQGNVAGWKFELHDVSLSKDNKNNDVIVLHILVENISAKWNIFTYDVSVELFQKEIRLDDAFYVKDVDPKNLKKEVRRGGKIELELPFVLLDTVSDVDVEFSDSNDFMREKEPIKCTIGFR